MQSFTRAQHVLGTVRVKGDGKCHMIAEYVSRAVSNTEMSLCAVSVSVFVSFLSFCVRID